jgi:phage-related minor tail protein
MANNIKGIVVEIGGNTGPLDKALQGVNKTSRDLQSELKQVERLLKLDPKNTELLAQKQKLLAESVDNAKDKLEMLREAEKQVQQQFKEGKISEQQYRALQREIVSSEQQLKGLEKQGKETNNVLSDERPISNFKKIGIAIGAALAAVGAAFTKMTQAVMDNADELQRQADVTGLSAERLQELQYAGNNLGVELETITGAQAKLTKSMANAKDETKGTGAAFAKLGVDVRDSATGELKNAQVVMSETITALGNIKNETERDALAMQIFGKSAMELNPLIKAGGDELNRLTLEAQKSGAVMSNEAVAGLDTFGDTLDNMKTSIMGAFGESLAGLLPKIQELISKVNMEKIKDGIASFAEKVVSLLGYIIENGPTITSLLAGIAAGFVAWNVATMIQGVVSAIKAFKLANEGATIAQWALNVAQEANPIGIVVMLIAGLVTAIIALWNTNEDFRNGVIAVWEAIKNFFVTVFTAIGDWFTKTWTGIRDFFVNTWNGIKEFFSSTLEGVKKVAIEKFGFIFESIKKVFSAFSKLFKGDFKGFFSDLWDAAVTWVKGWIDIGKDIVTGIWEGIKGMAKWISDKVSGFFSGIVDGVKGLLGIHSPSVVFAGIGENMAAGIGVGFDKQMGKVKSIMENAIPTNFDTKLSVMSSQSYVNPQSSSASNNDLKELLKSLGNMGQSINYVTIDAHTIKDFVDVVNVFNNIPQAMKAGEGIG